MPIPLWQLMSTGIEPEQELTPVDCGEVHAVLEDELNNIGRGTSYSWSWEHWVVNSCSLYINNTAHTGSTCIWKKSSILCIRSQGISLIAKDSCYVLWNVGLRDRPCNTLIFCVWKKDIVKFSSLFSVSFHFLSLIISFPYYWLGSRCKKYADAQRPRCFSHLHGSFSWWFSHVKHVNMLKSRNLIFAFSNCHQFFFTYFNALIIWL